MEKEAFRLALALQTKAEALLYAVRIRSYPVELSWLKGILCAYRDEILAKRHGSGYLVTKTRSPLPMKPRGPQHLAKGTQDRPLRLKVLAQMQLLPEFRVEATTVDYFKNPPPLERTQASEFLARLTDTFASNLLQRYYCSLDEKELWEHLRAAEVAEETIQGCLREAEQPLEALADILQGQFQGVNRLNKALEIAPLWLMRDKSSKSVHLSPPVERAQPPVIPPAQPQPVAQPSTEGGITFTQAFAEYKTEKLTKGSWRNTTTNEMQGALDQFIEIIGDIPLDQFTASLARHYVATLEKIPPHRNKGQWAAMSLQDILILNLPRKECLSPKSINNKYIGLISSLMKWGIDEGHTLKNPLSRLRLKEKKSKINKSREAFTPEELARIFAPATYLPESAGEPNHYWVPLIGLYTGARENEICQLHVNDIKKYEGFWAIYLTESDEDMANIKQLKSHSSERITPIHSHLIELGLIEFMESQKAKGEVRLFPELPQAKDSKKYYRNFYRWFVTQYLRKKVGINSPQKVFHSFRHTVASQLYNKDALPDKIQDVIGHEKGITLTTYLAPFQSLQRVVEILDYGLDIGGLRRVL